MRLLVTLLTAVLAINARAAVPARHEDPIRTALVSPSEMGEDASLLPEDRQTGDRYRHLPYRGGQVLNTRTEALDQLPVDPPQEDPSDTAASTSHHRLRRRSLARLLDRLGGGHRGHKHRGHKHRGHKHRGGKHHGPKHHGRKHHRPGYYDPGYYGKPYDQLGYYGPAYERLPYYGPGYDGSRHHGRKYYDRGYGRYDRHRGKRSLGHIWNKINKISRGIKDLLHHDEDRPVPDIVSRSQPGGRHVPGFQPGYRGLEPPAAQPGWRGRHGPGGGGSYEDNWYGPRGAGSYPDNWHNPRGARHHPDWYRPQNSGGTGSYPHWQTTPGWTNPPSWSTPSWTNPPSWSTPSWTTTTPTPTETSSSPSPTTTLPPTTPHPTHRGGGVLVLTVPPRSVRGRPACRSGFSYHPPTGLCHERCPTGASYWPSVCYCDQAGYAVDFVSWRCAPAGGGSQ